MLFYFYILFIFLFTLYFVLCQERLRSGYYLPQQAHSKFKFQNFPRHKTGLQRLIVAGLANFASFNTGADLSFFNSEAYQI